MILVMEEQLKHDERKQRQMKVNALQTLIMFDFDVQQIFEV